jgi:hypothetical protein
MFVSKSKAAFLKKKSMDPMRMACAAKGKRTMGGYMLFNGTTRHVLLPCASVRVHLAGHRIGFESRERQESVNERRAGRPAKNKAGDA